MSDHATLIGKALYLEFRKGVNTAQIIITPEGFDKEGNYVPVSTWRRQISHWNPKKPWKCYEMPEEAIKNARYDADKNLVVLETDEEAKALANEIIVPLTIKFHELLQLDWELYKEPIVIDFSMEDLMNTKAWETPSALIRRIMRARKEQEFSDELISELAE